MHPLRRLRIFTPELILRLPSEEEIWELAEQASEGLLEPAQAHFLGPWTQLPLPAFQLSFWRHHVQGLSAITPESWNLELCAYEREDGPALGCVSLKAEGLELIGTVSTGSWLLPQARGRGLGTQMRAGVLCLAFDELGAERARTTHAPDNPAGIGVSRRLGYRPDGSDEMLMVGEPRHVGRWLLPRERWQTPEGYRIEGLDLSLLRPGV